MPLHGRALHLGNLISDIMVATEDLDAIGYGDAKDEVDMAVDHLKVAINYMLAPDEEDGRDCWASPIRSPFHKADCYRRDEHTAPDQCSVD